jgi:hypothetical protein
MNVPCPFCAESIDDAAIKCKHCGEFLEDPKSKEGGGSGKVIAIVLGVVVLGGLCFVAMVAAIAIPNLIEARKNGNEAGAIGSLKTISAAQALFREGDKDEDGVLDYGTLGELSTAGSYGGLVDSVLGSGVKYGYVFNASPSTTTCEFLWFATASPSKPGTTGDRYFATNHEGVTYFSVTSPIPMNTDDCTLPQDRLQPGDISPIGR